MALPASSFTVTSSIEILGTQEIAARQPVPVIILSEVNLNVRHPVGSEDVITVGGLPLSYCPISVPAVVVPS